MNQDDKLIRMANQIAGFFRSYPDDQARTGIHDHLASFWTPKMRDRLDASIAAGHAPGLDPLVITALSRPTPAENPAQRIAEGPAQAGELGAMDAG